MFVESQRDKDWENFNFKKITSNYPKWPNETMLKLVFGDYLNNKINITTESRILDVGCGFGNNLIPFLDMGCECYGTEVTQTMAEQTEKILEERGYKAKIVKGKNCDLPFKDDYFDLLLSIGIIHYASSEEEIIAGLKEYNRVLKKNGRLVVITTAPRHSILLNAKVIADNLYKIQNYDFRDGTCFFCFKNNEEIKNYYNKFFNDVEV